MRVNCLFVASLVAGVVALEVGGVFLLVPFGYDDPRVEWGSLEPILKTNDPPHGSYEKAKADGLLG